MTLGVLSLCGDLVEYMSKRHEDILRVILVMEEHCIHLKWDLKRTMERERFLEKRKMWVASKKKHLAVGR